MKPGYIAIEGNIGVGKTFLTKQLSDILNWGCVLEEFEANPFLDRFYHDPKQYAFHLEMRFAADRFEQLSNSIKNERSFVSDYCFEKSLLFAKINLEKEELRIFKTYYKYLAQSLIQPDCLIFLRRDREMLLKNIRKRGRQYEQNIENIYLDKIEAGYVSMIKKFKVKTKLIEVRCGKKAMNRSDIPLKLVKIINEINSEQNNYKFLRI